jgi:molybdopterin/thiamine biosynthesis adenylyltransferase
MDEILCAAAGRGGHGLLRRLSDRGERRFAILDDDRIEEPNLPNLRLTREWLGWPKAKALAFEIAAEHGAVVRWADVKFSPALVDQSSPFADMIFRQRLFLALTDDLGAQLALAVTAARLEIPLIAVRVFAGGVGGDVFAQLDARTPCLACFTAHLRRTDGPREPFRGRDLPVGAGDRIDDFAADVALALLGRSREIRTRIFAPYRRFGIPYAWEVSADLDGGVAPIFIRRDPECPICGTRRRPPTQERIHGRAGRIFGRRLRVSSIA